MEMFKTIAKAWKIIDIRKKIIYTPVSYTHLDVYKRQIEEVYS